MNQPVIQVENLSKAYRIGLKEEIPDTLMGAVTGWMKAPLRNWQRLRRLNTFAEGQEPRVEGRELEESQESRVKSQESEADNPQSAIRNSQSDDPQSSSSQLSTLNPQPASDIIWALKNVSFDVHEGEVVGIIGRNGAGKSTLLKILSRITEPTSGRAVIRGRVSSLLEVGTGFHPELSGRENIYMNGTILGMRKKEIDRKFDEIVDFSGVEKFLDTPVKRYSSGMKVRLAFAVAAHLEPEVLIIDEVLAVGDSQFQAKCMQRMRAVASQGQTVLLVSHNMGAITALSDRGILLTNGALLENGSIGPTVDAYLRLLSDNSPLSARRNRLGRSPTRMSIVSVDVLNSHGERASVIPIGKPMGFAINVSRVEGFVDCIIRIYDEYGARLVNFISRHTGPSDQRDPAEHRMIRCEVDAMYLAPGRYRVDAELISNNTWTDTVDGAAFFSVAGGAIAGRPVQLSKKPAAFYLPHRWHLPSSSSTDA